MAEPAIATYSIAACDLDGGQWGVAVQSKFLAAAAVVSWAEPGAGAVATQAYANPRYGPDGLALLREGASAEEVVARLYEPDVAILPIGGHYTMDPREAALALELLGVKRCVPCHYGTFPLLKGTPEQLRELAPSVEVLAPQPGETITL